MHVIRAYVSKTHLFKTLHAYNFLMYSYTFLATKHNQQYTDLKIPTKIKSFTNITD